MIGSLFCFVFFILMLPFSTICGTDDLQQAQQNKFTSSGCQYSINDGLISDGNGHSRRMTQEEEQQMANYHAQVARATEEFQRQMAQVVQAPFRGFGTGDGITTPQLRLPEPPCFRVDNSSGDQPKMAQYSSGGAGDEENASVE